MSDEKNNAGEAEDRTPAALLRSQTLAEPIVELARPSAGGGAGWRLREVDAGRLAALVEELQVPEPVARVLLQRGFGEIEAARRHLEPRLADIAPPTEMAGFALAVERLARALEEKERIAVFGDYDVDGVSSAALVGDYLDRCGGDVQLRVARRDEGYGFSRAQAQELIELGTDLLLLVDCGTSDHEAVQHAADAGLDVIAIDHHRVKEASWPGMALVNPHRPDCGFPYKGLCTAGLAFYLVAGLRRAVERAGGSAPDPRESLDLVALGTLADVAPLDGVNRILVASGLLRLARTRRPGLRELLSLCRIDRRAPTAEDVGWRLGPRLNAPGRLGDASVALDCLWQRDRERAVESARSCDAINERRREIQRGIVEQASEEAARQVEEGRAFLLVSNDGWHPGVIGIVAGRLAEEFDRPAAVVAFEGESGRASARSVPGVDLFALLGRCAGELIRYGGHAAAAGFSVERARLGALADALHEATEPQLVSREAPRLEVDGLVGLEAVDHDFCKAVARLGPFGEQNPEPIFAARSARVERAKIVGKDHLAMALRQGRAIRQAIGFGLAKGEIPQVGDHVDVAFSPEIDHYQGPRLRLRLEAIAPEGDGLAAENGASSDEQG